MYASSYPKTVQAEDPRILSTAWIADAMGVDRSTPSNWIDAGVLRGRLLPFERPMRVVERTVFLMWVVNPLNWIYFDLAKVRDAYLKRLLELKRERWEDEWWTPGQVAKYHGLHPHGAHKQISRRAAKGHGAARWGNHRILKSVAVNIPFFKGKGYVTTRWYSERGDVFVLLARAVGISASDVARMATAHYGTKRDEIRVGKVHEVVDEGRAVMYRVRQLVQSGRASALRTQFDLKMEFGESADGIFADWKVYARRFPALAEAMEMFWLQRHGFAAVLTESQKRLVRGVLERWAQRFAGTTQVLPKDRAAGDWLERAYAKLLARGIDPFCYPQ